MSKKKHLKSVVCLSLALILACTPFFSTHAVTKAPEKEPAATAQEQQVDQAEPEKQDTEKGTKAEAADPTKETKAEQTEETKADADKETKAKKETKAAADKDDKVKKETKDSDTDKKDSKKQTKSEYTFESGALVVKAKLSDPDIIPDDAKLKATRITDKVAGYNYDAYMEALNKGEDASYTKDNTLLYDVAFIKDGKEIQPDGGTVTVTFDFKDDQLAEALGVKKASDLNVIHLPLKDKIRDKYDTTKAAKSIKAKDIEKEAVEDKDLKVNVKNETVELKTKDFSAFAFTVDFEYNGYSFSMPGKGSIELSKVFEQLHIDKEVENVEKVTFSDESLVEVKKELIGSDWTLKSKKAFSTEETLTVEMTDGEIVTISVTDSQDALEVSIGLYDYNDAVQINFPTDFGEEDHVYVFAWVGPSSVIYDAPDNTPWAAYQIDNIKGHAGTYNVSFDSFDTQQWGGQNVSYSSLTQEQKEKLKIRVVHSSKPLDQLKLGHLKQMATGSQQQKDEYDELWNGGFEGYSISGAHNSGLNAEAGTYEVGFKQGNKHELDVVLTFDPASDKGPIASGKSYILLEATSSDGNNKYYYVVEATTDGTEDVVYLPITGNWSSGQKFSSHWTGLTAKVIAPKPGKTIQTGGVKPENTDYKEGYLIGDYKYTYEGHVDHENDDVNHIDREEFKFKLSSATYEDAKTPDDVLGDAVDFGIVADTYKQAGHSETNYAVKNLNHNANTDVCGSGTGWMPFYVSNITGNSLDIEKTACPIDLYLPEDQDSKLAQAHINYLKTHTFDETAPAAIQGLPMLTEYHLSHSEIESYVDSMIAYGKTQSAAMAAKTTFAPVLSGNNKTVDTTQFPDGKTIYVDCSNCSGVIATDGWIINKLPNQSIVFNIPGENVRITEFHVNVYDESGTLVDESGSTTDAKDGIDGNPLSEKNRTVDRVVFNHIFFNAYEAETLALNNASGLFLAPNADTVTQKNGAGWILAEGTVDSDSEWHFYRHNRKYKAKGDFSLAGEKKIVDENGNNKKYTEFRSMTFTFELYECDQSGNITPQGAKPIESVTADKDTGEFAFSKLKYDQNLVEEGKTETFYYKIIERQHDPENGVNYDAAPVLIKVVATDEAGSETITFEISKRSTTDNWEVIENTGTDTDKVYEIGEFKNTYTYNSSGEDELEGTKDLKDAAGNAMQLKEKQFSFSVTPASNNDSTGVDEKELKKEATNEADGKIDFGKLTFSKEGTYVYTVKETSESGDGITVDPTEYTVTYTVSENTPKDGDLNVVRTITKGSGESVETVEAIGFTNTYNENGSLTLSGRKVITNKPDNMDLSGFKFTVKEGDEPVATGTSAADGTITFTDISYTAEGEHTYVVSEDPDSKRGVTNTDSTVTIKVTVTADGKGHLKATATDDSPAKIDEVNFTNAYDASGKIPLTGTKKFENGNFADETFTFSVYKKSDFKAASTKLLGLAEVDRNELASDEDLQSKKVASATTADSEADDSGKVSFTFNPEIKFTLSELDPRDKNDDGSYTYDYVVVEDIPESAVKKTVGDETFYYDSENDIKYDSTVYEVTITVKDKGDGTLNVTASDNKTEFGFENAKEYTKLSLTKSIDKFIGEDTDGEYVNATLVFRLTYDDPLTGEKGKTREVSVQFDKDNVTSQTIEVEKIPIDTTVEVKEIYSSNYKPGVPVKATKGIDEKGYPIWTVSLDNEQIGTTTGSGIINNVNKNEAGEYEWNIGEEPSDEPR